MVPTKTLSLGPHCPDRKVNMGANNYCSRILFGLLQTNVEIETGPGKGSEGLILGHRMF